MKSTGVRLAALLACLCACGAYAADSATVPLSEEIAAQEAIYKSTGADVPAGYVIDRSLTAYTQALAEG